MYNRGGRETPQFMLTPRNRRMAACLLSLALAVLACARAELSLAPVTPDYATRQPPTATLTPLPATATATADLPEAVGPRIAMGMGPV